MCIIIIIIIVVIIIIIIIIIVIIIIIIIITQFLPIKLWARIPLQAGESPLALFPYLCVSFHKCVRVPF